MGKVWPGLTHTQPVENPTCNGAGDLNVGWDAWVSGHMGKGEGRVRAGHGS